MALGIVVVSVFIVMLTAILSVRSKEKNSDCLIDIQTSIALKGFAIMLVVIHHYGQLSSELYSQHSFLGFIGVTVFFFVSGYVSEKQLLIKGENYVKVSFIRKKVIRLYVPYVLNILLFAILGRHAIISIFGEIVHVETNEFLMVITIFYVTFMLLNNIYLNKALKQKEMIYGGYSVLLLIVAIGLYMILCIFLGAIPVWYNTAMSFPLGAVAAYNENRHKSVFDKLKKTWVLIVLFAIISIVFSALRVFSYAWMSTLASFSTCVVLYLILEKIKLSINRTLAFVGSLSWEIYLCHPKILYILRDRVGDHVLIWFVGTVACSLTIAFVLSKMAAMLTKRLSK